MFEYLAAARPIIASDLPSIREILDNKVALLVKPGDANDLAEKIESLANQPKLAADIAVSAKAISVHYSWEERAKKIYNFLCG